MKQVLSFSVAACIILSACGNSDKQQAGHPKEHRSDTVQAGSTEQTVTQRGGQARVNDTLNAIAGIIAGLPPGDLFKDITGSSAYAAFGQTFNKRWQSYDSSRLEKLRQFSKTEIAQAVKPEQTLFYPFSGPDILYAYTFFPSASTYVMLGLEPVGTLPQFGQENKDSLKLYFNKINTSLNAILKYSFFRTESMGKDLRNQEVNGTLHLLLLFLKRTGNSICSAKPLTIDSTGQMVFTGSFEALKKLKAPVKGVEIKFLTHDQQVKTVYYYSLNAADGGLKYNKGFTTYLAGMGQVNTYLKGASYLMHKSYFSIIRNVILKQSEHVVQDDSGIAFHYFTESGRPWKYTFYGKYTRPIPMFSQFYQKDLDSCYKANGSKDIGFGIGYNFKDMNSNFMIATATR